MTFFSHSHKGNNAWHLYLIGVLFALGGYFVGQLPLTAVLVYQVSTRTDLGPDDINGLQENMDFTKFGLDTNTGFLLMILMFVFAMLGLYAAVRMQKKSFITLITPKSSIDYQKILMGFLLWTVMIILSEAVTWYMDPAQYTFRFSASSFIPLLMIAIFLLPIQTSFEELFFRGYLMQAFGLGTKNKLLALGITSLLFALMHGMNPEIEKFGLGTMMFYYISAGAYLGLITLMDDSLELALGVHAATNILGATLITYEGSVLQTDTLFMVSEIKPWMMIVAFYISAIIFYVICSKKYHWKPLTYLLEPIEDVGIKQEDPVDNKQNDLMQP
ncbi:MAG: CPBP family intramembrane metalloprotease [Saprospiraceae bacterium]|nr:CPBP family intramembrane metalloprotease [Saprospiraceae bacterium]